MMTNRQLGWRKLFLIFTVLPCYRSLQVSIPVGEYEAARGADITLTCAFVPAKTGFDTVIITWGAFPDNEEDPMKSVATYFNENQIDIAPAYEGRAFMDVNLDKRESTLRLTKVTMQDSRRYQCKVLIPGDDEGIQAAATSLLVLVAPSQPICSINGRAEYWHDISLTCKSEEGSPIPSYQWQSFSVENNPRQFPPKTTEKDGVLSLFNISREMSGFYICTSTNRIASASCNFTLAVMPGGGSEASIAAIAGGVVAGVLVLGILIFCCCRRKGKKDKYVEGAAGDAQYYDREGQEDEEQYVDDKSNSETKRPYEDKSTLPQSYVSGGPDGHKFDDDQNSHYSGQGRNDGKGSDIDSQRYRDDQHDRDRLEDQRDRYGGSRDRLEDQRDRYGGSRDRLEDQRDRYGGSRDRLEDQRDRYGGSRDRLDDQRDRYRGSRDRLDDQRDRYGGSRDRLDDQRDHYRGSRDRLDDQRDHYRGSRDRLDDQRDHYRGSRDRLDDHYDRQGSDRYDTRGSRDRLDYREDQYRK